MPGRGERDLLRECVLVVGGMRTVGRRGETRRYMWKRRKGEKGRGGAGRLFVKANLPNQDKL